MKSFVLASAILSLFLITCISLARDVPIDLKLQQQNVNIGDEIPVTVVIGQVSDLKGLDILISFDNLRLEYKSITKEVLIDGFVEDILTDPEISKTTGEIEYLAVLEESGPGIDSPGGPILTINFVAKSPGDAWIKLDPNDVSLSDSRANEIPNIIDIDRHMVMIDQVFNLKQVFSYPNPAPDSFGNTTIRVEALALLDGLEARIYDISGELVKKIDYEDFDRSNAPVYEYLWNCKNEADQDVANGTYIMWLKASLDSDEKDQTWKIAVLR
jgi:hypothetical protein